MSLRRAQEYTENRRDTRTLEDQEQLVPFLKSLPKLSPFLAPVLGDVASLQQTSFTQFEEENLSWKQSWG